MRDQLVRYPGKVHQYPRNLVLEQDNPPASHLYQINPKPHWNLQCKNGDRRSFRHSVEDLSLSRPPPPQKEKRKPKSGLTLVRKLSRLLSPSKEEKSSSFLFQDPVAVHIPTRSRSLEGERRYLSRKQILESLEEEENLLSTRMEVPGYIQYFHQDYPQPELREAWLECMEEDREERRDGLSSESSSESGSLPGDRFSRCVLIQSISEELSSTETGRDEENLKTEQTFPTDNNDNKDYTTDISSCDNQQYSQSETEPVSRCPDDWLERLRLDELSWVGTLGIGGFGRVELVTAGENNNMAFALKKMKKNEITDEKQQQHILNEKKIMSSCSNPFIVKLHRTFRDSRYLYMLMEPCLGGELWTILRNKKKFDDESSRFYTACVIKAFDYLHDKGIVYRDLKPENLLLDSAGYIKLTDFGFSKRLEPGEKSWTFCGTPEYVAPEIITNKSHDQRADIWSVGILMYELLNGIPPFSKKNSSSEQVYSEILQGMKHVNFPSYMSATSVELIRQLCRLSPSQRPSLSITRRYMWFAGMDWTGLENRTLTPPYLPVIAGVKDTSNFDNYKEEEEHPEESFADWDQDF